MQVNTKLKGHKEICEYLRIGKQTFYELLEEGMPVCIFGNAYRADAEQIDEWYSDFVKIRRQTNAEAQI